MADKKHILHDFLILLILLPVFLPSCQVPDYLYYNLVDIHDYKIFPTITVHHGPKPYYYHLPSHPFSLNLPDSFQNQRKSLSLNQFLTNHHTVAFLVIRNDTILHEAYFRGFRRESYLPSFSIAKSFVSALLGIAISEGSIESLDQPVTDFIPEMKDPGFQYITLRNLVEMKSGIRYNERYIDPFGNVARFYYGDHLMKYVINLKTDREPGLTYEYQSANTEILAIVIERATGKKLPVYLEEKIWKPLGMEYDANWSVDSETYAQVKAFCCLNGRAVDFAKFGSLYLSDGIWRSDTLVAPGWVHESLTIHKDDIDSQGYPYAYHWRSMPEGDFFAKGVLGQYIYVNKLKHLVIIRFGKMVSGVPWIEFFRELSNQL